MDLLLCHYDQTGRKASFSIWVFSVGGKGNAMRLLVNVIMMFVMDVCVYESLHAGLCIANLVCRLAELCSGLDTEVTRWPVSVLVFK